MYYKVPEDLVTYADFDSVVWRGDPRTCISYVLHCDADAAGM